MMSRTNAIRRWRCSLFLAVGVLARGYGISLAGEPSPPAHVATWLPEEGAALLGQPAPEWRDLSWVQDGPLSVRGLRGRAVLLRFWLFSCPYCKHTAPALNELWDRYRKRGLVIVGVHQPMSDESFDASSVTAFAKELGFKFPVAVDSTGETLVAYGHGTVFHKFSSMSFLIDRRGIIRFVHEGGEYHLGGGEEHRRCNEAYEALLVAIDAALSNGPD